MSSFNLEEITPQLLDQFRNQTDPIADDTVAKIIASGEEQQINKVMMLMFQNDSFQKGMFASLGDEISQLLDEYIESTGTLPEWAELDKVRSGEKLFSLYGPEVFMLLNVSSLPLCYTCAKGAQVLYDTGRLLAHNNDIDPLARRLMETAQMVVNVLTEGGLSEGGKGIVTLQKVRLIHASIRHYLKEGEYKGEKWDVSEFGEPINQEDLAGTLMSFGPVILSGLDRLNISLSDKEQSDYMHCWKVVGYLMGIDSRLLPDSYGEGFGLATAILKHQSSASEAGKALTDSCIQFMNYLIPGNTFNDIPNYFIHYFLEAFSDSSGVDLASCIGVNDRSSSKDRIILGLSKILLGGVNHLEDHKFVQKISSYFNKKMLEGIIHHFNHGKNVHFFIPPSLQKDWGLMDLWEDQLTTPGILGHRLALQKKGETIN